MSDDRQMCGREAGVQEVAAAFDHPYLAAFGHPYLAEFGQFLLTKFGQTAFGQFFVFGGGRNQKKWGPEGVGARRGEGPEISRFFFLSPAGKFVLFFPLWGSSRGILVVFEASGRSNVHVWSSRVVL